MVFFFLFSIMTHCQTERSRGNPQKKKTIPLFRYCPNTRKYNIVFWRCFPFPVHALQLTLKTDYWTLFKHPQKSNHYKSVFFFFLVFTKPYCQTERCRSSIVKKNHTLVHESRLNTPKTLFHKNIWGKHFYKKKDKKEAKGLFRVFKKASSSLRFRIKSPPSSFQFTEYCKLNTKHSSVG